MANSSFYSVLADPPIANLTAITATTETILHNVSRYSPIAAYDGKAASVYDYTAFGIMSFAATGNLTITPRVGLTVAAGITLGASIAKVTPGATTNQPWIIKGVLCVRTVGDPGVTSTAVFGGSFVTNGLTTIGSEFCLAFGGTSATFDSSIATGLCIGWTLSVAGTCTPQFAQLVKRN